MTQVCSFHNSWKLVLSLVIALVSTTSAMDAGSMIDNKLVSEILSVTGEILWDGGHEHGAKHHDV